ncbi:MAG: penicillin-insensitive murein endopeptidase [Thermoproteota archaeon]
MPKRAVSYVNRVVFRYAASVIILALTVFPAYAGDVVTKSIGHPFNGRLENGIPFPRWFEGYTLRELEKTYTTPEVIGALLHAISAVRKEFPNTYDLYLGDFSKPGGGPWYPHHKSHQNGRDVDIGFYFKTTTPEGFIRGSIENLDLARTWSFLINLIKTYMVEKIFLDFSIQKTLFMYGLSKGYSIDLLGKIFQLIPSRECQFVVVCHEPNHADHFHVRFIAPWSELAGLLDNKLSNKELALIANMQSRFLPIKTFHRIQKNETLESIAKRYGMSLSGLLWVNKDKTHLRPGISVLIYKPHYNEKMAKLAFELRRTIIYSLKLK